MLTRKRLIVVKPESTYGTDSVPTGAQAIQVADLSITPLENDLVERKLVRPHMGGSDKLAGGARVKIEATCEYTGAGAAGTVPNVDALLRACGMAAVTTAGVKVEYSCVSGGFESATIYYNQDGLLHKATGCRGTWQLDLKAKEISTLKFSLTGIYNPVTDAAMLTPTLAGVQTPVLVSADNTTISVHGYVGRVESFSIDQGNVVAYRETTGGKSVDIVDRDTTGAMLMEMPTIAQKNWFDIALKATTGAVAITHGTVAGNIVEIAGAKVSVNSPTYQDSDGTVMLGANLAFTPNAGNDEIKLTFR